MKWTRSMTLLLHAGAFRQNNFPSGAK